MQKPFRTEDLGGGVTACTDADLTVGTDAFLLSYFAAPRRKDWACDLGCGNGVIPLLWFREPETSPKAAIGLDIQPRAVYLARQGATISGLEGVLTFLEGDLRALPASLPQGGFDLVTCNPPYKPLGAGVMSSSAHHRTARHETACTIDDVCAAAARLLRFGGRFCLCQLPERLPDVTESMRRHRLEPKRLRFVQERADTPPWLLLCEGKLGAKPFLRMEQPLLLRENGEDSAELREIYRLYGKGRQHG